MPSLLGTAYGVVGLQSTLAQDVARDLGHLQQLQGALASLKPPSLSLPRTQGAPLLQQSQQVAQAAQQFGRAQEDAARLAIAQANAASAAGRHAVAMGVLAQAMRAAPVNSDAWRALSDRQIDAANAAGRHRDAIRLLDAQIAAAIPHSEQFYNLLARRSRVQDEQREARDQGAQNFLGGAIQTALGSFAGFGLAQAGARVAGFFKSTVAEAFQLNKELQGTTANMEAFTHSTSRAKELLALLRKEADVTPFETREVVNAGQALIPFAKTNDEMLKLLHTAETLAALNPMQGLEGAGFSLREALSGDFTSLIERFNISRQTINSLKKDAKDSAGYIAVVDKALASMGVTYDLVAKQGQTFEGRRSTLLSYFSELKRVFGEAIFQRASTTMGKLLDQLTGPDGMKNVATAMEAARRAGEKLADAFDTLVAIGKGLFDFWKGLGPAGQQVVTTLVGAYAGTRLLNGGLQLITGNTGRFMALLKGLAPGLSTAAAGTGPLTAGLGNIFNTMRGGTPIAGALGLSLSRTQASQLAYQQTTAGGAAQLARLNAIMSGSAPAAATAGNATAQLASKVTLGTRATSLLATAMTGLQAAGAGLAIGLAIGMPIYESYVAHIREQIDVTSSAKTALEQLQGQLGKDTAAGQFAGTQLSQLEQIRQEQERVKADIEGQAGLNPLGIAKDANLYATRGLNAIVRGATFGGVNELFDEASRDRQAQATEEGTTRLRALQQRAAELTRITREGAPFLQKFGTALGAAVKEMEAGDRVGVAFTNRLLEITGMKAADTMGIVKTLSQLHDTKPAQELAALQSEYTKLLKIMQERPDIAPRIIPQLAAVQERIAQLQYQGEQGIEITVKITEQLEGTALKARQGIIAATRSMNGNLAKLDTDWAKTQKTQAEQMTSVWANYAKQRAKTLADFQKGEAKAVTDHNRQIADMERNTQRDVIRIREDGLRRLQDMQSDFDLRSRRSREDFNEQRQKLLAEGKIFEAGELTKQFEKQQRRETEDFSRQRAQTVEGTETQATERQTQGAEQVKESNADFARQQAERRQALAEQLAEQRQAANERAGELAKQQAAEKAAYQQQRAAIVSEYRQQLLDLKVEADKSRRDLLLVEELKRKGMSEEQAKMTVQLQNAKNEWAELLGTLDPSLNASAVKAGTAWLDTFAKTISGAPPPPPPGGGPSGTGSAYQPGAPPLGGPKPTIPPQAAPYAVPTGATTGPARYTPRPLTTAEQNEIQLYAAQKRAITPDASIYEQGGVKAAKAWIDAYAAAIAAGKTTVARALADAAAKQMIGKSPPPEGPLAQLDVGALRVAESWVGAFSGGLSKGARPIREALGQVRRTVERPFAPVITRGEAPPVMTGAGPTITAGGPLPSGPSLLNRAPPPAGGGGFVSTGGLAFGVAGAVEQARAQLLARGGGALPGGAGGGAPQPIEIKVPMPALQMAGETVGRITAPHIERHLVGNLDVSTQVTEAASGIGLHQGGFRELG